MLPTPTPIRPTIDRPSDGSKNWFSEFGSEAGALSRSSSTTAVSLEVEIAHVDRFGEADGADPELVDGPADDHPADEVLAERVGVVAAVADLDRVIAVDAVDEEVAVVADQADVGEALPHRGEDRVDDRVLVAGREAPSVEEARQRREGPLLRVDRRSTCRASRRRSPDRGFDESRAAPLERGPEDAQVEPVLAEPPSTAMV